MIRNPKLSTLMLAAGAALALSACSRNDEQTAGQKVDAAIAETQQAADEAKAKLEQEGAEAKAKIEQGTAAAQSAVEQAAADTKQGLKEGAASVQAAADKGMAAVDAGATKAADAVEKAADKAAVATTDALITTAVNAELAKDSQLSALKINVDTKDGRVTLNGTAPSTAARDRATTLSTGVKGVKSVDNKLEVRG